MRVVEADRARDLDAPGLGLHPLELDAVIELDDVHTAEPAEEVEVPPRATELAVGRELQPGIRLFYEKLADRLILDLGEGAIVEIAGSVSLAGLVQRLGAKEAADDVGAEWRVVSHPESVIGGCRSPRDR